MSFLVIFKLMFPFVTCRTIKIPKGIFVVIYFLVIPAGILLLELLPLIPRLPNGTYSS